MRTVHHRYSSTASLAVLLVTLLAAMPAAAGHGHFPGGMGGSPERMERMATELGLSEQQRADFERIMGAMREQSKPLIEQMRGSHKAMKALIEADAFDEAAVRAQAQSSTAVMTELAVIHARNRFDLRQILTPEQREKMQTHHRHHRGPKPE